MDDKLVVGKVVAPHGVRGDVRIMPLTDFPDRFTELKNIFLEDGTKLTIERAKFNKQFVVLKFFEFASRNDIEHLRGKLLKIERKDAVKLPEGEYYTFEIIGLKVYDVAGTYLGVVGDVLKTGSNDVYVTKMENGKQLLIPALKSVVHAIDVAAGQMIVTLQEEWD